MPNLYRTGGEAGWFDSDIAIICLTVVFVNRKSMMHVSLINKKQFRPRPSRTFWVSCVNQHHRSPSYPGSKRHPGNNLCHTPLIQFYLTAMGIFFFGCDSDIWKKKRTDVVTCRRFISSALELHFPMSYDMEC